MKEKSKTNPYATLKGGKIEAPRKSANEPKTTRKSGNDLRVKRS